MLKNYYVTMVRNLLRSKGYTALNIFGLTIGIAAFLFIWLWVQDELSYDKFHKDHEKIFIVMDNQTYNGQTYTFQAVPGLMASAIRDEVPEVEFATTVNWENNYLVSKDSIKFLEKGIYAESDFFKVFDFPILHSATKEPAIDKGSIAISRKIALKYFNETNVIGKTLKVGMDEYIINVVLEDIPANSTIKFNLLLPYQKYFESQAWLSSWENNGVRCFVKLHDPSSKLAVNEKIRFMAKKREEGTAAEFWLQELTRIRLYSKYENGMEAGGRIDYINIFTIVAFSILAIASINFINLTTARSANRAKEVAMRKTVGAGRSMLVAQFLIESVVMSLIAAVLSLLLVQLMLPLFNEFTTKQIINPFLQYNVLLTLLMITLITGVISGIYPAFLLSNVNPIKALKGQVIGTSGKSGLRKSLVVVQLTISVVLIISSLVVFEQINFIKNKNLGLDKESIIMFDTPSAAFNNYEAYKNSLGESAQIISSTVASQNPLNIGSSSTVTDWPGIVEGEKLLIQNIYADQDFTKTLGINLVEGEVFKGTLADTLSIIVNEEAVSRMNLPKPATGTKIKLGTHYLTIVGVMQNFHSASLHTGIEPICIFPLPRWGWTIAKFHPENNQAVISHLEKVYKEFESEYPFDYAFLADLNDKQYGSENVTAKLALMFTFLTVIISCLGLLGLSSFTAERRVKELGIRKVMGATVTELVTMLCSDYAKLAALGIIIGSPIAYYVMNSFLNNYAFHTELNWYPFALTGVAIITITLLTVSYQSIKATLINPASSLRSE